APRPSLRSRWPSVPTSDQSEPLRGESRPGAHRRKAVDKVVQVELGAVERLLRFGQLLGGGLIRLIRALAPSEFGLAGRVVAERRLARAGIELSVDHRHQRRLDVLNVGPRLF